DGVGVPAAAGATDEVALPRPGGVDPPGGADELADPTPAAGAARTRRRDAVGGKVRLALGLHRGLGAVAAVVPGGGADGASGAQLGAVRRGGGGPAPGAWAGGPRR